MHPATITGSSVVSQTTNQAETNIYDRLNRNSDREEPGETDPETTHYDHLNTAATRGDQNRYIQVDFSGSPQPKPSLKINCQNKKTEYSDVLFTTANDDVTV